VKTAAVSSFSIVYWYSFTLFSLFYGKAFSSVWISKRFVFRLVPCSLVYQMPPEYLVLILLLKLLGAKCSSSLVCYRSSDTFDEVDRALTEWQWQWCGRKMDDTKQTVNRLGLAVKDADDEHNVEWVMWMTSLLMDSAMS